MAAKRSTSKNKAAKKKAATKAGKAKPKAAAAGARKPAAKTGSKAASGRKAAAADPIDPKVRQIQAILDVMLAAGAVELETDDGAGGRLRLRLKEDLPPNIVAAAMPHAPLATHHHGVHVPAEAPAPIPVPAAVPEAADDLAEVLASPMVGTFYRAPAPDADPFVSVGDAVGDDTTICVIEAMKVMNEIKAEMQGTILEILVENGEPVEFGQPLFRVARG